MRDTDRQLLQAVEGQDAEAARRLVQAGSDVNAQTEDGITPLFAAVCNGDAELAAYLVEQGADVNFNGFGERTALMAAAN